jgi:hypothetical protein
VLFAFMAYAVGSDRSIGDSIAVLLGHTVAYLVFGIALAFAFETISRRLSNPEPLDFGIALLVGVLLFWVAWRSRGGNGQEKSGPSVERLTPPKAFGKGGSRRRLPDAVDTRIGGHRAGAGCRRTLFHPRRGAVLKAFAFRRWGTLQGGETPSRPVSNSFPIPARRGRF